MRIQAGIQFVFKFTFLNVFTLCLLLLTGCGISVRKIKAKDVIVHIKGSLPTSWVAGVPLSSGLTVGLASSKLKAGQLNGIKGSVQLSLHSDASCLSDAFQANTYQIAPLAGMTEASLQDAAAVFPSFAINLASTSNNGNPIYLKATVFSSFFEKSSSLFYCSPAITVTPGALSTSLSKLELASPVSSPVAAGSPMTLALTLLDAYGNPSPIGVTTPSFSYTSLGAVGIFGNIVQNNNAALKPYEVVFTSTQGGILQKFTAISGSQSFVLNLNPSLVVQGNYGARLAVTTEPVNSNLLIPLSDVVVKLQDPQSNLINSGYDVSQGTPITVSLLSGSGGFTSGSTLSVPLIGGIATFSNLAFTTAGTKILAFTKSNTSSSGGFSALQVESAPFVISSQVFPTPQNLAAIPSTSGSSSVVQLSWMASSATAGPPTYFVYRGTTPDGQSATPILSSISCTPSASCSALDLSVTAGVTYYYKVVASSAYGQSLPSNEAVAKPIGSFAIAITQGAPASSTAGNMVITLSPAALPAGASTYGIQYASSPTFSSPSPITFCSSTDALTGCTFSAPTGLVAGQSYYFRMVATNAYNGLQYSDNTPSAIVLGLPSAPTLTSSTVSSTSFSNIHETYGISWDAVAGASGYILHWGTSSGVYTSQTTTASTSATVSGLNLGTPHYFSVSAVSSTGNLDSGELLVNPPSAPQGPFQLNASSHLNTLTWFPSPTSGVQYNIWRSSGGSAFTPLQTINSSSCSTTCSTTDAITPGTQYTYALFAADASNVASSVLTESNESIGSFSVVAILAGTGAINISIPVAPLGATAYSINISTTSDMSTPIPASPVTCSSAAITSTGCTISSLTVGSMAYFTVTATNASSSVIQPNSGAISAWVQATPVIATASVAPNPSNVAQENVTLNWTPAANTNYAIHWGSAPGGPYPSTSGTVAYSAGQAVISSIPLGASYYFVLQASNTTSDAGGTLSSSELAMVPPSPIPAFTSLSSVPGSVSLNWSGPSSGVTYNLWRSLNSGSFNLIQTGIVTSSYQDSSVTNGSSYAYVVQAESSSGLTNSTVSSSIQTIGTFSTIAITQGASSDATASLGSLVITPAAIIGATTYAVSSITPTTGGSSSNCVSNVCTVTGLTAETAYTFTLTASNASGATVTSSSTSSVIPLGLPSIASSSVVVNPSTPQTAETLTLNWATQTGATSYTLLWGTDGSTFPNTISSISPTATTTSYNFSGTVGTSYYFKIRAVSNSGATGSIDNSTAFSMIPPSVPQSLVATPTAVPLSVQLSFSSSASLGNGSGLQYNVWRQAGGGSFSNLGQASSNAYTDSSISSGVTYGYFIQAQSSTGISSPTSVVSPPALGTAYQLAFTTQPTSGTNSGATMSSVSVAAQDAYGNTMPSYSTAIVLSLPTAGTSGNMSGATLSGTTSKIPTSGVSSYTDLSIQYGTTGYTLVATSGSLISATSNSFTINQVAFSSTITFTSSSDFNLGGSNVSVGPGPTNLSENNIYLTPADQTDDDNSSSGFGGATLTGAVQWDSTNSYMRLSNSASPNQAHDSSWSPAWSTIVGYWKLDEATGDGTIADSSPVGTNSGTISGGVTQGVTGVMGNGITLNGSTGYITTANTLVNPTNFSYSGWFKTTTTSGGVIISFGDGASNADRTVFMNNAGNVCFSVLESGTYYNALSTVAYNDGYWHHFSATFSSTAGSVLYVDGVKVAINTNTNINSYSGQYYLGYAPGINLSSFTVGVSSNYFSGSLDDVVVWNTATLTDAAVFRIYDHQSSKSTGTITSRVMDAWGVHQRFRSLNWVPTLPFLKGVPDGGFSEVSSQYPSMSPSPLMSGVIASLHLNDNSSRTSAYDYSGNSNHGTINAVTWEAQGKIGFGASFNGISSSITTTSTNLKSVSFWMKANSTGGMALFDASTISNATSSDFSGFIFQPSSIGGSPPAVLNSSYGFYFRGSSNDIAIPYDNIANGWHHIAISWDGASSMLVGIDGTFPQGYLWNGSTWSSAQSQPFTMANGALNPATSNTGLTIGKTIDTVWNSGLNYFQGVMNEFIVWSRALTSSEILGLYRRGANRIIYQIQTCSSSNCISGAGGWIGMSGTNMSYFSEINNNTVQNPGGGYSNTSSILATLPSISTISSVFSGVNDTTFPPNRYYQYRAIFETDDANNLCNYNAVSLPCSPELKSVIIGPNHYFKNSSSRFSTKNGISYSTLTSMSSTFGAGGCSVGELYALGNSNSGPWKYWNGSAWVNGTGSISNAGISNGLTTVNANLSSFPSYSNLFLRVWLRSSGENRCELNSITIQGLR